MIIRFLHALFIFVSILFLTHTEMAAQSPRLSGLSLFADVRASRVGDIVTLTINENTSASNNNNTQTDKREELGMESEAGVGGLDFIPGFGINSSNRNTYQGNASISSTAQMSTQVSTRIVEVMENGYFVVSGSREIEANGEKTTLSVTGIIRPEDIGPSNTVSSAQVAELQVFLTGKGVSTQGQRPGIVTRVLNWIF